MHPHEEFLPFVRPTPPRLSDFLAELIELENSGIYSNFGPINTRLETELIAASFGEGHCLTVCNATSGLMLAIRDVIGEAPVTKRRYALMPSFTFAATAQAALWCGLTPLLCDIDPQTWLPCQASEEALLQRYGSDIAVVVPYATFGNNLDLGRYQRLSAQYGVPVVVDAAASLSCQMEDGRHFGAGFQWPVVFSMHATKSFSVGEGGLIYCADRERIDRLRCMSSFGFGEPRSATMHGLNAKMAEMTALTALLQLRRVPEETAHRTRLSARYRHALLPELLVQKSIGRQVRTFEAVLLPPALADKRAEVMRRLEMAGVGVATYFSPHLAQQPYIAQRALCGPLPVTEDIASRILCLPLLMQMTSNHVDTVALKLGDVLASLQPRRKALAYIPKAFDDTRKSMPVARLA